MPLDFPSSPTTGDIYTLGDRQWRYNGSAWDSVGFGPRLPTAAPASPAEGDMYLDTATDIAYVRADGVWTPMNRADRMTTASSAPSSPATGALYLNTSSKLAYIYTGTAWTVLNQAVLG